MARAPKAPIVNWVGFRSIHSEPQSKHIVPSFYVAPGENPDEPPSLRNTWGVVDWVRLEGRFKDRLPSLAGYGAPFADTLEVYGWWDGRMCWRSTITGRVYPFSDRSLTAMLRSTALYNGVIVDSKFQFIRPGGSKWAIKYVGPASGSA